MNPMSKTKAPTTKTEGISEGIFARANMDVGRAVEAVLFLWQFDHIFDQAIRPLGRDSTHRKAIAQTVFRKSYFLLGLPFEVRVGGGVPWNEGRDRVFEKKWGWREMLGR